MKELIKYLEGKINPDFDFDIEHWDNSNFDDSYNYGVDVGKEYAYREVMEKINKILKKNK